jgi:hypothetical protein
MIEETVVEGKRLGRHIEHDPKSRDYGITTKYATTQLKRVHHRRYGIAFDQGDLGSCTGNAAAGCLNTLPDRVKGAPLLNEANAVNLYSVATAEDDIPGTYPPDDTGSSGLGVAKACYKLAYITEYRHAFSIDDALSALQERPIITGVNWYEGFDEPDAEGYVEIAGQVRGGHEFEILGFEPHSTDIAQSMVIAENSWGTTWGYRGRFRFTVATWDQLLSEQGDATILIV